MALETVALNASADGIGDDVTHISLHTANPGGTGANEVSGGGYTRQTLNLNAASGGIASAPSTISFVGPASSAITHVGLWASSTWYGSAVPTGDLAFNAAGELDVTVATVTATNG